MKKRIRLFSFLILTATFFAACNKETFHESIGFVANDIEDETEVGSFIFSSVNATTKCGEILIFIDDKQVGKLKKNFNGNMACNQLPLEGQVLKVVATAGNHTIKVQFPNGCREEVQTTYNLQTGKCMWYYIP